ncbi:MAG: cell division protein ZapD [Gammaproteobacteria bacterium]|nr:cell division protein ZapD [Gammaproteobacteria bacterium]
MTHSIIYELPLNERIRILLRLEFLFKQARSSMCGTSISESRNTIHHILSILHIMGRLDLRSELIKELERQSSALLAISSQPDVDSGLLEETLEELNSYAQTLRTLPKYGANNLHNNYLLKQIQQRASIPGGNCDFDIPVYHFWLKQASEQRTTILQSWLEQLDHYRLSINIILKLLRKSSINTPIIAKKGFYQQSLDINMPFQLIQVLLPDDIDFFAEISGGRHRFSVHFMTYLDNKRPTPCTTDIEFQLSCCAL